MKARGYVGLGAVALIGVIAIPVVDEHVVNEGSNAWQLGYNYVSGDKQDQNPLYGVPEESWPAVSERLAGECEEDYEVPASAVPPGPDPGGPDWEDFCAGKYAGYVDQLRGTYVRFEEASYGDWDYD